MRYAMLIYSVEEPFDQVAPEQMQEVMDAYNAFGAEAGEKGVVVSGDALDTTDKAKTISIRDGKTLVTNGPYAETKEALGGFYILNCRDEAEALEWAAKIPGAKWGYVEVRPVMEFE
jgi:hypothetical protein